METPHIDSLAKKGFNFGRDIHRPPHAPTRCSIISGRHPAVLQKTHVVGEILQLLTIRPLIRLWIHGIAAD